MRVEKFIEFVRDTFKTKDFIPLHEPRFEGNEKNYLANTIDTTFVSSVGEYVNQLEDKFQTFLGVERAVAVVNGTAGLQVALRLAGVNAGEEVLCQALTFIATANAIAYNQALPIFIDVDLDTMGLSPSALEMFLEEHAEIRNGKAFNKTSGNRIAACVPMHTFGLMSRIDEISAICAKWNIPVVEDAAEALGSTLKSQNAGTFGMLGVFSLNGNKIITSGGGGVVVTNNKELGQQCKHLTTTAKVPHPWEFKHDFLGYNFRMPNINAALACAQMENLRTFLNRKAELFKRYREYFEHENIHLKEPIANSTSNYWLNAIELPDQESRDTFLDLTNKAGIMTRPIWELMFNLPMYKNCIRDHQKNAIYLSERIVNIPSSAIKP